MSVKKSNTLNSQQLTKFKFRWWMALILIGVVAVLGIVILRFSHAGGNTYRDTLKSTSNATPNSKYIFLKLSGSWVCATSKTSCTRVNLSNNGVYISYTCATLTSSGYKNSNVSGVPQGSPVDVSESGTYPYINGNNNTCS